MCEPSRLGGRRHALAAASLLILALAAMPAPSRAQGAASGVQPVSPGAMVMSARGQSPTLTSAVLINAQIVDDTPAQAHIVLNFNTHAPAFSIVKSDGDQTAIAFVSTTRGNSVRTHPSGKGLLRSIDFEQQSSIMMI